jgi:uncharacterized protein (TIGR00106 family)
LISNQIHGNVNILCHCLNASDSIIIAREHKPFNGFNQYSDIGGEAMIIMFSIIPIDKGESISTEIARAINLVDQSGLTYQTTAMGTLIEGNWDEVMNLIKRCHDEIRKNSRRVYTRINIDDREGANHELTKKVASVELKVGRGISK